MCGRGSALEFDASILSRADARSFTLPDGRETHAFVYAPTSDRARGPQGARPPLLVKSHGGPTSATSAALDPRIQFWTSRGFAVADVNYSGSSGYGRAYRDLLERAWGQLDVDDCSGVATALADEGFADPARLAISGRQRRRLHDALRLDIRLDVLGRCEPLRHWGPRGARARYT